MTRRQEPRGKSRDRRFPQWPMHLASRGGAALLAASVVACSRLEGPSGVHVSVALSDASPPEGIAFDHITLVATSGPYVASACLYVPCAIVPDSGAVDPCADAVPAWQTPPTAETWSFGTPNVARSIDFVFPVNALVDIHAEAHLGGGSAVGSGDVTGAISTVGGSMASIAMAFSQGPACAMAFRGTDGGAPLFAACMGAPQGACCSAGSACRTSTVTCTGDGGFIVAAPIDAKCPASVGSERSGDDVRAAACASLALHGHFFRCLQADAATCIPTSDCDVPDASLVFTERTGDTQRVSLACLPPLAFSASVETTTPFVSPDFVALEIGSTSNPRACVFTFDESSAVGVTATSCGPGTDAGNGDATTKKAGRDGGPGLGRRDAP